MVDQVKNSKLANQIYLVINVLNLAFFIYVFLRLHNVGEFIDFNRGIYLGILIVVIGLMNFLSNYAKKNGGVQNPIKGIKKARLIHLVSIVIMLSGIILFTFLDLGRNVLYVSLLAIPIDIYAMYIAHNRSTIVEETDLIDDFKIDEH